METHTLVLLVNNVQLADSGEYMCRATNDCGMAETSTSLDVSQREQLPKLEPSFVEASEIKVTLDEQVSLIKQVDDLEKIEITQVMEVSEAKSKELLVDGTKEMDITESELLTVTKDVDAIEQMIEQVVRTPEAVHAAPEVLHVQLCL